MFSLFDLDVYGVYLCVHGCVFFWLHGVSSSLCFYSFPLWLLAFKTKYKPNHKKGNTINTVHFLIILPDSQKRHNTDGTQNK